MKTKQLIYFGIIISLFVSIIVIAQTQTTKQIVYDNQTDKDLLIANGFSGLPYSLVTCDGINNCSYYITRADQNYVRDLGTKDKKTADSKVESDMKKYMDNSLANLKASQIVTGSEGKIEVVG